MAEDGLSYEGDNSMGIWDALTVLFTFCLLRSAFVKVSVLEIKKLPLLNKKNLRQGNSKTVLKAGLPTTLLMSFYFIIVIIYASIHKIVSFLGGLIF